jgi:hypothetical protein
MLDDETIRAAQWYPAEQVVIDRLIESHDGPRIRWGDVAMEMGIPRRGLYHAITRLIAMGVVVLGESGHSLARDASKWFDPRVGQPMLVDGQLIRHRERPKTRAASQVPTIAGSIQPETIILPGVIQPVAKERQGQLMLEPTEPPRLLPRTASAPMPEPKAPEWPTPETSFDMPNPGPCRLTDEECRPIWNLVWKIWGDIQLCHGFYKWHQCYPAEIWRKAFATEEVYRKKDPTRQRNIKYIMAICNTIQSQPESKSEIPKESAAYLPPSQRVKVEYFVAPKTEEEERAYWAKRRAAGG